MVPTQGFYQKQKYRNPFIKETFVSFPSPVLFSFEVVFFDTMLTLSSRTFLNFRGKTGNFAVLVC